MGKSQGDVLASAADNEGIRWALNNLESRICKQASSPNKVDSTEEEERHNYGRRRPDLYPAGRRRRPNARPRGGLDRFGGRQRNNYWAEEEEEEEDEVSEEQGSSSSSEEDASAESSDSESGQEPSASASGQSRN